MISALMTVFNGEKYIAQTIESILAQTYALFELIIVNDGSTDLTGAILQGYEDSRIKVITLKNNVGVGAAIVEGLKYTKGDFIAKVDADDIYSPNRFEVQLSYLIHNPSVDLIDCQINYFPHSEDVEVTPRYQYTKNVLENEVNGIINSEDIAKYLYWFPSITHSMIMFRRQLLDEVSYNPTLRICEDYDFFYRLNKKGIKMSKISQVLGKVRVSSNSTTVVERHKMIDSIIEIKEEEIQNLYHSRPHIYIWGTGELGQQTYKYLLEKYSIDIQSFIDSDSTKYSLSLMGKSVLNIKDIENNSGIIVASSIGKFEISKILEEDGYHHLVDYLVIL